MRAITLHQPWASLIAVGAKTIETRSWKPPQSAIGERLAIHAGLQPPRGWDRLGDYAIDQRLDGAWGLVHRPLSSLTPLAVHPMPLGAVVASCALADVVPIIGVPPFQVEGDVPDRVVAPDDQGRLRLWRWLTEGPVQGWDGLDAEAQRPFGDFSTGGKQRYAWVLEDVKLTTARCPVCWSKGTTDEKRWEQTTNEGGIWWDIVCLACDGAQVCDPIPAKGRQGLWEWTP